MSDLTLQIMVKCNYVPTFTICNSDFVEKLTEMGKLNTVKVKYGHLYSMTYSRI